MSVWTVRYLDSRVCVSDVPLFSETIRLLETASLSFVCEGLSPNGLSRMNTLRWDSDQSLPYSKFQYYWSSVLRLTTGAFVSYFFACTKWNTSCVGCLEFEFRENRTKLFHNSLAVLKPRNHWSCSRCRKFRRCSQSSRVLFFLKWTKTLKVADKNNLSTETDSQSENNKVS